MPKAKTTNKSKPAKKTFHKHVAEAPVASNKESTPQTTPPADEKVIQPEEVTPVNPQPNQDKPTDTQPEQSEEDSPISAEITPPTNETTTPKIPESITPPIEDTNPPIMENISPDSGESTPAPEESQQLSPSLIMDENESKSKKPLIIVVIFVVILIILGSLYFLYTKKLKTDSAKASPTPISQTSEASPSPSTQILNKADWTLEILNGSTKKGAAAELSQKLTEKGYQIINTGNAPEDVTVSQVFFSDSKKDQADLFLEDIKDELLNPTNAGSLQDSTASARIIIGAE